jgi:hypothetical protein
MIAVWMIYSMATSALIVAASLAVERLCLSFRWPTRWVWAGGMMLSLVGAANNWRLVHAGAPDDAGSWTTVIGASSSSVVVAGDRGAAVGTAAPRQTPPRLLVGVARIVAEARQSLAFDPSRFESLSTRLLVAWLTTSGAAVLYLAAAIVGMRRLTRDMPLSVIDGHRVLMSRDIGPALIGVVRARIVLPRWTAELSEGERRLVLAHEWEHAAAGDPLLLVAGVALVAIQAWNVALWFAVARLRLSIESDCDSRVLRHSGDPGSYGRLLVRVHTRSVPIFAARLAFTSTTSKLESRIQRLLGAGRPKKIASALSAASWIVILTAAACLAPTPVRASRANVLPAVHTSAAPRPTTASERAVAKSEPSEQASARLEPSSVIARSDDSAASTFEAIPRASIAQSVPGQVSRELGCGRQSEGFAGPTFAALRNVARERYGSLFQQVQTTPTVIAFAVDGTNCTIRRDTVLTIPVSGSYSANVLYSRAFPELPEHSPEIGLGDAREREVAPIRGNPPLMILYALTNIPRERASCSGVSVSANSTCSITGEVVIRVMDSTRVLIATESHLFMFTSADPMASVESQTIQRGHIEYADGAVSVLALSGSMPTTVFNVRNGTTPRLGEHAEQRFDAGVGLSHYAPTPVPLDAIGRLRVTPCPDSDTPVGSCFEADGKVIRFPR